MSSEVVLILALILANGVFAGTELAILEAKRNRLEEKADDGNAGAKAALQLQDDPSRFLAAVQIGITMIGVLLGAIGGTGVAVQIAPELRQWDWISAYADEVALILSILVITYLTLIFGELVPKKIALLQPERYASTVAVPISLLARLASPLIGLLSFSTNLVLRLLGQHPSPVIHVTEEDIRELVREGAEDGVVDPEEQQFIESIFRFSDRAVRHIMTPRREVEMVAANAPLGEVLDELLESGYSRFPVYEDNPDQIVGIAHVRDLLLRYRREGPAVEVRAAIAPPLYVSENSRASALLATFRKGRRHMAVVIGELGGVEGVVTLEDVLEEIVGEIDDEFDDASIEPIVRRDDGSLLVEGSLPIDELKQLLEVEELPDETTYRYDTLAGFVIALIGRIPRVGDHANWQNWRFEVMDMDGLRVDKVLIMQEAVSESE